MGILDRFKKEIDEYHGEIMFSYKDANYFISDSVGDGPNGERILISGPDNDEFVNTTDEALDKLMVDGLSMRERIDDIKDTLESTNGWHADTE